MVPAFRSIQQDSTRNTLYVYLGLHCIHRDVIQRQVAVPMVGTSGGHAMLITDYLPELGTNLVVKLASLVAQIYIVFLISNCVQGKKNMYFFLCCWSQTGRMGRALGMAARSQCRSRKALSSFHTHSLTSLSLPDLSLKP